MDAEDLQIEADGVEVGIVELAAEHHAHDKDFVRAFHLGFDEELREDVQVRNGDHELAARHQYAMPLLQGRLELGIRDVLEHVTGIERLDRVRIELREILAIADVIDFGACDEVQSRPAGIARARPDQQLQLTPNTRMTGALDAVTARGAGTSLS